MIDIAARHIVHALRPGGPRSPAAAARVLATACVYAVATVLLLCVLGWAGHGGGILRPALTAAFVLAVTANLAAVSARLSPAARRLPQSVAVATGLTAPRRTGLAVTETVLMAVVGSLAGLQAHLAARGAFHAADEGAARLRDVLSVGREVPVTGLLAVLVVVPLTAALASALTVSGAVGGPRARAVGRALVSAGPVLAASGLIAGLLPAGGVVRAGMPRTPGMSDDSAALQITGFVLVVVGTGLAAPGLLRRTAALLARRARRPELLCAARRVEADAARHAPALMLLTATGATAGAAFAVGPGDPGASGADSADLMFLTGVGAGALCASAVLFAVLVDRASACAATARTLRGLGVAAPAVRRGVLVAAVLPFVTALGASCAAAAAMALDHLAAGHGQRLPLSGRAVVAGALVAVMLPVCALMGGLAAGRVPPAPAATETV